MSEWQALEWQGVAAHRLTTSSLVMTGVHGLGPRIAEWRLRDGENLLLWAEDPAQYVREMPHRGEDWFLRGGHRLWVARPGADEAEETYVPDSQAGEAKLQGDQLEIWAAADAVNQVRKGLRIRAIAADTVQVEHLLRNEGVMLFSGGIWGLTCTVPSPDCRYVVPLGDDSEWNTATIVHFAKWAGGQGQSGFVDDQFAVTDDALVIQAQGRENKRMALAPAGVIGLCDRTRDCTFTISAAHQELGVYPLGTNIAAYVGPDNFMVEMETMAPFQSLKPGAVVSHVETWRLRAGRIAPEGAAVRRFAKH